MKKILSFFFLFVSATIYYAQSPCSGTPTITYAGKTYNTIQVGNQCWLKENIDIGNMINGNQSQANNNVIEKYCYQDDLSNCEKYGGLYSWNEAMKYTSSGNKVQGICPGGWHLPTLDELTELRSAVNNDGNSLKEIGQGQGIGIGAGTNTSGFSALLSGSRGFNGQSYYFSHLRVYIWLWSSTDYNSTYTNVLELGYSDSNILLYLNGKEAAFSVRCLKGDGITSVSDDLNKKEIPTNYSISQNYPNPFNPSTKIKYQISTSGKVSLNVFDLLGNKIATLVNDFRSPGSYTVDFDGENIPSGIYFYRIQVNEYTEAKKMILIK
ncbi:MAG: T9SS type A sorting domain-containing protein [Ignavibacteriales bacterium]|nr:T9SS type A sorting domain-containing protein [Ignavibacteriales bacterium]